RCTCSPIARGARSPSRAGCSNACSRMATCACCRTKPWCRRRSTPWRTPPQGTRRSSAASRERAGVRATAAFRAVLQQVRTAGAHHAVINLRKPLMKSVLLLCAALAAAPAFADQLVARNGNDSVRLDDTPCTSELVLKRIEPTAKDEFKAAT